MSKRPWQETITEPVSTYRSRFGVRPLLRTQKNVRSVTAKQVIDAVSNGMKSGRYVLSNSHLFNLRFCARIIAIEQEETHTDFIIDDGTGRVKARIWPKKKSGETDLTGATIDAYYDIVGDLVQVCNEMLLRADTVRKVCNHNTITMHMIAVIHEHCTLGQLRNEDVEHWDNAEQEARTYMRTKLDNEFNKEAVIEFLSTQQARDSECGPSAEDIFRYCHFESGEGWKILEEMLNEGSIYSTTSSFNFKIVENK